VPLPYADRAQAGAELGERLRALDLQRPVLLGIPRGGVAVAGPAAAALHADLDVIVVRKLGAPRNPELAIGAVGPSGDPWLDEHIVDALGVTDEFIRREVAVQRTEAQRRVRAYRGDRELVMAGRDVVVVDDGIATGATVIAAGRLLRRQSPARIILAVPVAPAQALAKVGEAYDRVLALHTPDPYYAVGQWYADFRQVSDDEVRALLEP
jgi:putative phosphoribosyl transferase